MPKDKWLSEEDPSSFSNSHQVRINHSHLDLEVDFDGRILRGAVTHSFVKLAESVPKVILDTRDLIIKKVVDVSTQEALVYNTGQKEGNFGAPLEISLPDYESQLPFDVRIEYETTPSCSALQWLKPEQTAGKLHPYMFSQCQAIHCRSMIPCQDSPAVKAPYNAKITVPANLVALMSAVKESTAACPSDPTKAVHNFTQKVPVPSYLIAIVTGALESREIGPRSKVWSEKEMVEQAAHEFSETEDMLKTAEDLLGPYVWGVYDLLVLPPSFPYGGMENPCLTFVTPTLLAGDRSLASVVAHEITHSWMGNLVTVSNWEHFWLNEGNTVFVERKILGRLKDEAHRHLAVISGWKDLSYQVHEVFGPDHPHTRLVPDLSGVDPDDAYSSTPYEKGSLLLMNLEELLGGPEVFEKFLKAYIEEFKYLSITTEQWKDFLYEYFSDQKAVLDTVDWESWFFKPGMPPVKPKLDGSLSEACTRLASRWSLCSDDGELDTFCEDDVKLMSTQQLREFLAQLLEQPALAENKITKMQDIYRFNDIKNSEIKFRWLRLCLKARRLEMVRTALDFVNEQGRMKFVRPIYRDLYGWEESRQGAIDNYRKNSQFMHQLTAAMVAKDMKLD